MNGIDYDKIIQTIRDSSEEVANSDIEAFCKYSYDLVAQLRSSTREQLPYSIPSLHKKLSSKTFDEEALKHANNIIDAYIDEYRNELEQKIKKNKNSVKNKITGYWLNYRINKIINGLLQLISLVGSIGLPFIINIPETPKLLPTIVSILVATSIGLLKFYKFREHAKINYRAAENLSEELNLFISERGAYKNLTRGTAFDLFMDRIDQLRHEQKEIFLSFEENLADEQEIELIQKNHKS